MKRAVRLVVLVIATGILGACATRGPLTATSNPIGDKVGKTCRYTLLHTIPIYGHNDIATAAKNAQIQNVSVVDTEFTNFVLYTRNCTVVYGK
ncbi:MAG TPA: TRL domain-containing protein [Bdellovibrionota bacterium]|jgi:hypothetical protein|nr:TRL domain-containing protein [Bdellovibrionota bacterium]